MLLRLIVGCGLFLVTAAHAEEPRLIAHLPLQDSATDVVGQTPAAHVENVTFDVIGPPAAQRMAARFDGEKSVIRIPSPETLRLGSSPFSVAAWVYSDDSATDVPGDILSQYDPATRTGFHLGLYTHEGVTNAQANRRQLHFGIDQGHIEPEFKDHGQLGNAVYVFSLCSHAGKLYASTCHPGESDTGRVYRLDGEESWTDLGSPDRSNAISAMATYQGELYVASSKYRLAGSALGESENKNLGGKVYRMGPDGKWISCGTLSPETEAVSSLIVFQGQLYAASLYRPAGFFRYDGGETWTPLPTPEGKRVEATAVFNGGLFATCYDEGAVFRFNGTEWSRVGTIPEATQTYGLAVHRGQLYVSEWPKAHVYKYLGGTEWEDTGKLGGELEAMPLVVYNGKLYCGTLPLAEVYRYDEGTTWTRIGRVDQTPDVKYRRAWSMAVHQGRLYVGALPSGRVLSIEAGRNATHDYEFPTGWHHIAAVKSDSELKLYVDGREVVASAIFGLDQKFDLTSNRPLEIGFGAQDYFQGGISDVRIYRGDLSPEQIRQLATP